MDDIDITCPGCGSHYTCSRQFVGSVSFCKQCQTKFEITPGGRGRLEVKDGISISPFKRGLRKVKKWLARN